MKEFWNSQLTEKSWEILKKLKELPIKFTVIGGWAAYLWTRTHKSKDIDIVVEDFESLNYLKQNYELKKNNSLKKYEIKIDDIDIDIYVIFYSKLAIPIEEIPKNKTTINSIDVVSAEALLLLKQGAELDRKDSIKGEKDRIDIMTLLIYGPINPEKYRKLTDKYKLSRFLSRLKQIIISFKDMEYLGLNPREYKNKKQELIKRFF